MRVLVLGATGKLGRMLQWGWRDHSCLRPVWHGRKHQSTDDVISFDILSEPSALRNAVVDADVILCLAGMTPAAGEDLSLNRSIALSVRDACRETPLLIASSASVYGFASGICRETSTPSPASAYGTAKLEMEQAVLASGSGVTCLRICNIAGADQLLGQVPAVSPIYLDQFKDGRTPIRSYLGPLTVSRILAELVIAAGRARSLPAVLNVAAPGGVEMGALLNAVPQKWVPRPAPSSAVPEVVLDTTTLGRFIRQDVNAGRPDRLVGEWRAYRDRVERTR